MSDERPEALLKSALEKIIYFEARSEQLSGDLRQSREEAERLRRDLAAAAEREISVRAQLAEVEVRAARFQQDRDEQARLNDGLRRERKELIGKLIDASRLQAVEGQAPEEAGGPGLDLASFIAELRGEVLGLREVMPATSPAPALALAPAGASMARHAERFQAQGRLEVSASELWTLAREPQAEETLFGFSVRELCSPQPSARVRAAGRLCSMANRAAAPALAGALQVEAEGPVLVALLEAFAPLAGPEGAAVVVPHLRSPAADVRISALRALLKLDPGQAAPHLSAAMKDPDPAVRRRASLLALGLSGEEALRLGEEAGRDAEPKVRALGALALGAAGGPRARASLTGLLHDADASVRQAASRSLSSILGTDVSAVVPLDDARRRREIRRLAALPDNPVTAPPAAPRARPPAPPEVPPPPARAAAPRAPPPASPGADEALCAAVLAELRSSIRGRGLPDLARALGVPEARAEEACALASARGQAVRRGLKYFVT